MRKVHAPIVVLGLLVAGIAVASTSASADDSAVTKHEIKVGITYPDLAPLRPLGVNIDHGNYEKSYQTVIDDINAHGGVNGRKIVPVYAPFNPVGTVGAQQACLKLTEDQKVFAVVGSFYNDGPLCYLEQHDTPVVGGNMTTEYLARAKAPWYTLEPGDRDTTRIVDAMIKEGLFNKGNLGIVTNVDQKATLDNVVLPALKKNKVSETSAIITAPPGDAVAAGAEAATIVEKFKTVGVKNILLVRDSVLAITRALAPTSYRPRLIATAKNTMAAYLTDPASDLSVVQNAVAGNVSRDFNDPALQKCYAMVSKATGDKIVENPPQGKPSPVTSADAACRYMTLFANLAAVSGKNLTTATFGKAAQKAGSIEVPGSGKMTYDTKTHEFNQPVYMFRFSPATKSLVKDSKPVG
jgi:ABC-type branched-subunit amino acid transport system substrate-binding protein